MLQKKPAKEPYHSDDYEDAARSSHASIRNFTEPGLPQDASDQPSKDPFGLRQRNHMPVLSNANMMRLLDHSPKRRENLHVIEEEKGNTDEEASISLDKMQQ